MTRDRRQRFSILSTHSTKPLLWGWGSFFHLFGYLAETLARDTRLCMYGWRDDECLYVSVCRDVRRPLSLRFLALSLSEPAVGEEAAGGFRMERSVPI